jgi:hypothetical protein
MTSARAMEGDKGPGARTNGRMHRKECPFSIYNASTVPK